MLYDIAIDNVSTMASYRDEFNRIMNDGGYSKLVDRLTHPPTATPR
jgi:ABC-type transporter MlaC component